MKINRFALYLIPLLGIVSIPQLLFFWLAPEVPCYMTVYAFGTAITIIQLAISFFMWMRFGVRKSAAITAVGSSIALGLLLTGAILLGTSSSVRTAAYCLSVISVVYVVAITPLVLSVFHTPEEDHNTPPVETGSISAYNPDIPNESNPTHSTRHRAPTIAERYARPYAHHQSPPPLPERR